MQTAETIKQVVKEKYGAIAKSRNSEGCGCNCGCGSSSGSGDDFVMNLDYSDQSGYVAEADLGLGCGLPTEHAGIQPGDTVLDLGSGAGNDAFVARALTGETGAVIGVDMTPEMVDRANRNLQKLGFHNVIFKLGEIENLPVASNTIDVTISNCVLNLVPDKRKAFAEIHRTLKPGGHFCISDVVTIGRISPELKQQAELYVGCVSGALEKDEYLQVINGAGFVNVALKKERRIEIDDELLAKFLSPADIERYHTDNIGIYSVTVYGVKP